MPNIHYNPDEIIRPFARLHLRRMELANPEPTSDEEIGKDDTARKLLLKKNH